MKVSAKFNEQGLQLILQAESEPEKKMIGAVINQPFENVGWGTTDLHNTLLSCRVAFDGHWTHKCVDTLTLSVYRQENSGK